MSENGKIVFGSDNQTDFSGHKLVREENNERFPVQVSESTETALADAIKNQFKSAFIYREDSDLSKKGAVFFEIEGNELVEKTFAVDTTNPA
jgi:hypothetical protein